MTRPFASLLIANRGEIAVRVARTAKRMGIRVIAVYSDADANAAHVAAADEAVHIGPSPARDSYLKIDAIIDAARRTKAEAVHPGYGFLSENAAFAEACEAAGIVFVGPPASAIRAMGLKDRAKALMAEAGVAVVPGYLGDDQSATRLAKEAAGIGYPVLIKAVAGGGGKGMRRVEQAADFEAALASAQREAKSAFGDDRVLIEKYVSRPRHIEMQIFGDRHGNAVHLFERDCSLQRRHQKVIEEAPAPGMSTKMRAAMGEAAVKATKAVGYVGAGTVEFIADASEGLKADRFWFMEMNTRLQVEHPVTEAITGLDLVEWQLRVAAGEPLPKAQDALRIHGHAIEARLYAEDPARDFLPSIGTLERLRLPEATNFIRVDTGVREGDTVTMFYDPMIAKVIGRAAKRDEAAAALAEALAQTQIAGVHSNAGFLVRALRDADFLAGDIDTGFIERHRATLLPDRTSCPVAILARAAEFLVDERACSRANGDPWDAQDGFRLCGEAREVVEFAIGGKRAAVEIVHHRDSSASFFVDGESVRPSPHSFAMRLSSGEIAVTEAGETFTLPLHDPLAAAETEGSADDALAAPMPGKIVQIFVKPGDEVVRGTALAVLEAMKMEHTLTATRNVHIETVDVAPGQQVREGAVVVRFAKPGKAA
jgi:3-methylcrotonyl-CoA carboxylase alpha subunit